MILVPTELNTEGVAKNATAELHGPRASLRRRRSRLPRKVQRANGVILRGVYLKILRRCVAAPRLINKLAVLCLHLAITASRGRAARRARQGLKRRVKAESRCRQTTR